MAATLLERAAHARRWAVGRRAALGAGLVAALVAGLGAGAAFGYFGATGSGAGTGTVGSMQSVTLTAVTGTPTAPLVPGGTGDVVVSVHNPNPFSVSVGSIASEAGGAITFDSGHGACATGNAQPVVTLSVPANDLPVAVPPSSSTTFHLANAVTMDATATSNCQGATVYIPVVITVHSS